MELAIIGENHIKILMVKKLKKQKSFNPIAKNLRTPKYKSRIVRNKKIYSRKKNNLN